MVASPQDLEAALRRLGHDSFRPGQREAVETLLREGHLLLVAPTGGGKSLTYQLPATLLEGTTLVISPLVALMNDQVSALEARGVSATFLAATLPADEMRRRMARLGDGAYRIAYVAPEMVDGTPASFASDVSSKRRTRNRKRDSVRRNDTQSRSRKMPSTPNGPRVPSTTGVGPPGPSHNGSRPCE